MSWLGFAGVFAAFFVTHSIPTRPPVKARLVALLGARGFTAAYSALSLLMLGALIAAAGAAPQVLLWGQAAWHYHAVQAGMLAVCLLAALAIGRPNPFSFGGGAAGFDPAHPGVVRWLRHPLLVCLFLWAALHLLPNGNLAHVILFGLFAGFALLGRRIVDRRKRRLMGAAQWQALWAQTRAAPYVQTPRNWRGAVLRAAAGLAVYAALLALHQPVIGVSPLL